MYAVVLDEVRCETGSRVGHSTLQAQAPPKPGDVTVRVVPPGPIKTAGVGDDQFDRLRIRATDQTGRRGRIGEGHFTLADCTSAGGAAGLKRGWRRVQRR